MPAELKQLIHASQIAAHKRLSAPESPLTLCYVTDREREREEGEWDCAWAENLNTCCFVPCGKLTYACVFKAVMADWKCSNHFYTPCIWRSGYERVGEWPKGCPILRRLRSAQYLREGCECSRNWFRINEGSQLHVDPLRCRCPLELFANGHGYINLNYNVTDSLNQCQSGEKIASVCARTLFKKYWYSCGLK